MTREEAIAFFKDMNECTYGNLEAVEMAIKALEQEPSREFEDYENCKECRKDWTKCGTCSVMMQWIKDNKQEPCEDCISKKAVLDKINEICFSREQESVDFRVAQGSNGQRDLIINFIENLPSVQSKPKTEVLDKIKAEIDRQEKWLMCAGCNAYNVDIAFNSIKKVLKESRDKE